MVYAPMTDADLDANFEVDSTESVWYTLARSVCTHDLF